MLDLFNSIFKESKGVLRAVGTAITFVAQYGPDVIPALVPYAPLLTKIGVIISSVGVVKAKLVKK